MASFLGDVFSSAFNAFTGSNPLPYIQSLLNPQGTQQSFNAQQSQLERDFNAQQADKERSWNASQAEISRKFNASEAQKQRDYESYMSNSAYSRAIADLKANGLNPYLAINSGASTPSGSVASSSSAYGASARSNSARSNSARSGASNTSLVTSAMKLIGMLALS